MRLRYFSLVFAVLLAAYGWLAFNGTPPRTERSVHVVAVASHDVASTAPKPAAPVATTVPVAPLFDFVNVPTAAALNAALPAPTRAIRYVSIDRATIERKSSPFWQKPGVGQVALPLGDGRSLTVVIDASEMLGANRFVSTGHLAGDPKSRAVFAYNDGFLTASVEDANHAYSLRPATESVAQFYEVEPDLVPPCGGARHPQVDADAIAAAAARKARQAALAAQDGTTAPTTIAAATDSGQRPEVQLLMLYTQAVKPTLSGAARVAALQSEFDAVTAKVNAELAASQINAHVKLVKIAETQYDESVSAANAVQDDALTALYKTNDGKMDEIHALRDQVGADVVCLALNRADSYSIGLSYVLDTPSIVDASAGATNPLFAFAVVQYATMAGTDVVPHELGHVFGCAHARGDPGTTGTKDGAYTYSYGYRFYGTDGRQYHDIMAYSPGTPLGYYSNPKVTVATPINAPIGIAPGQANEADAALTIQQTAFEVSTYRLQTPAAASGVLVNVATRAYVGTGDSVLIGGFAIDGAQPKRVLIRGIGPTLANYGVTNALADPVLKLYSNGNVIAQNDDWSNQASAIDVAAAMNQVGAFALPSASTDSALLVTLQPGLYSGVVEGKNGTSGSGMVEVYDVDKTGNKIVNLSTRGYAAPGKEMIGGFVVQGAAGTTKRILIRVLGPTLGHTYNVSGAMDDPILELHNAAGDLVLKNDDWSSGDTAGTSSATNDFSPWVKTYSESQIAATGFAPSNRREPCVMLDLPAGSYTAIAQPFEDLTSTPAQPAQPGVAIVEVYEINP